MTQHYFSKKPTGKKEIQEFECQVEGKNFKFKTGSGVFSKCHIDDGAFVLATKSKIKENSNILDLGCGWGPVGIIIASLHPSVTVTLSDINERAVELAQINAKENINRPLKVVQSDGFESIKDNFDTILLNPPQTAGRQRCKELIRQSKDHLKKEGDLIIVARAKKGGKTLAEFMKTLFNNVETIARKKGFHLYQSINKE